MQRRATSLTVRHDAAGKRLPRTLRGLPYGIFAGPILHVIFGGKGLGPDDSNGAHLLSAGQIEKHPLWVQGVVFALICFPKIRIALPKGILIAICQTRISFRIRAIIAVYAAMR